MAYIGIKINSLEIIDDMYDESQLKKREQVLRLAVQSFELNTTLTDIG